MDRHILKCSHCEEILQSREGAITKYSWKCEHHLCHNCFKQMYDQKTKDKEEKCMNSTCELLLTKMDFKDQTREDFLFDLDQNYRKDVLRVYNKQINDFSTIDEYDTYLLEIENKID